MLYLMILTGDWNSCISDVDAWLHQQDMRDGIMELHSDPAPDSFQNLHRDPLDVIYISSTIAGIKGLYLAFKKLGGDNSGMILDIPDNHLLGFQKTDTAPPLAQGLQLKNPATVEQYSTELIRIIKQKGLDIELQKLLDVCTYPMTEAHIR